MNLIKIKVKFKIYKNIIFICFVSISNKINDFSFSQSILIIFILIFRFIGRHLLKTSLI